MRFTRGRASERRLSSLWHVHLATRSWLVKDKILARVAGSLAVEMLVLLCSQPLARSLLKKATCRSAWFDRTCYFAKGGTGRSSSRLQQLAAGDDGRACLVPVGVGRPAVAVGDARQARARRSTGGVVRSERTSSGGDGELESDAACFGLLLRERRERGEARPTDPLGLISFRLARGS